MRVLRRLGLVFVLALFTPWYIFIKRRSNIVTIKDGDGGSCEDAWEQRRQSYETYISLLHEKEVERQGAFENVNHRRAYDLYEPEWVCDTEKRVGPDDVNIGDGPKFVCDPDSLQEEASCLVYSIGSHYDFRFEDGIRKHAPNCIFHTFDGTMNLNTRALPNDLEERHIHFHHWNVDPNGGTNEKGWVAKTIQDTLSELGHNRKTIHIFKIDCEGCEYGVLPQLTDLVKRGIVAVEQIQVEMHGADAERIQGLFQTVRSAGFAIFHKERNHWGCNGYRCVEYAFVSMDKAKRAFIKSHCLPRTPFSARTNASSGEISRLKSYMQASERLEDNRATDMKEWDGKRAYDMYNPEWTCASEVSVGPKEGNVGNGPKFICGIETLKYEPECLVYSIGSNHTFQFEMGVQKYAENCEFHVFDGTMDLAKRPLPQDLSEKGIHFHNWNVQVTTETEGKGYPSKGLEDILRDLNHMGKTIHIFKIDCEGCEYKVLASLANMVLNGTVQVGQIQVEVHGTDAVQLQELFRNLRHAGFMIFHKETNQWGCQGYRCVEYSFISTEQAKKISLCEHCHTNKECNKNPIESCQPKIQNIWTELPQKKVLFTHFITISKTKELIGYWKNNARYLFQNKSSALSVLITYPSEHSNVVIPQLVHQLNLRNKTEMVHECEVCVGHLRLFDTGGGSIDVLLQAVSVYFPTKALRQVTISPTCSNRKWPVSYALYSGAFFSYHALQLPVLKKFDFYMKIDSDIGFHKQVPLSDFNDVFYSSCSVIHSQILPGSDCERGSLQALRNYAELVQTQPLSFAYNWCNPGGNATQVGNIFYGNFVGFSQKFLEKVNEMARWLYFEESQGYFTYRWGDQAPWMMYSCMYLDIPNIYNDSKVCDISSWRHQYFKHY